MKIEINKMPEAGFWAEEAETAKEMGLSYPACQFKDPIKMNFFVNKVSGDLLAQGPVTTQAHIECSRCLNDFIYPIDLKKFTFCEPIGKQLIIDLTDAVTGDIILALPSKPLCKEDCQGLCVKCGQDLNSGKCSCAKDSKDIRLAELDKIKFD